MNLENLTQEFSKLRCLVVGDVMLDRYITGHCDRISPEAPVPVVHHKQTDNRLGGAANVALNLKQLGVQVNLCAIQGRDENGEILSSLIREQMGNTDFMYPSEQRQTTVKTRVIAHNQHLLRVDREDTHPLTEIEYEEVSDHFHQAVESFEPDIIVLQDYNKGLLTRSLIREMLTVAESWDILTAVDPKFEHFFDYAGCHLFKPNLKEIRLALQHPIAAEKDELDRAADELLQTLPHKMTCVTLSEQGIYLRENGRSCIVPTTPRNIVDVCGAGDAVIAVLAALMPLDISLEERGKVANSAGGQVCEQVGVVPLELKTLIEENDR